MIDRMKWILFALIEATLGLIVLVIPAAVAIWGRLQTYHTPEGWHHGCAEFISLSQGTFLSGLISDFMVSLLINFALSAAVYGSDYDKHYARTIFAFTLLFGTLTTFTFAEAYMEFGLVGDIKNPLWDHLYFSIITMTTVGYGDLTPCPTGRLIAAIQAILGIINFTVLIGSATSAFAQDLRPR